LACGQSSSNDDLCLEVISSILIARTSVLYNKFGARNQIRTDDLTLTKGALYHWSYAGVTDTGAAKAGAGDGNRTRAISLEG
jgi:hypothetical protein